VVSYTAVATWSNATVWHSWANEPDGACIRSELAPPDSGYLIWNTWSSPSTFTSTTRAFDAAYVYTNWLNAPVTGTVFYSGMTWEQWVEAHDVAIEQRQAALEARRAEQERLAEVNRLAAIEREAAKRRARFLLLSLLNERQRAEFEANEFFHVHTREGNRYRLRVAGLPVRVDDEGKQLESLCIHPVDNSLPAEDALLMHKLHLETDETSFRTVANITRLRAA
jgi:hypothetical protein